jgi:hypothetical protein
MSNQEAKDRVAELHNANLIEVLAKLRRVDRHALLDEIDQVETKQFADDIVRWYDALSDEDFKRRLDERYPLISADIEAIRNNTFDTKQLESRFPIELIKKNMEIAGESFESTGTDEPIINDEFDPEVYQTQHLSEEVANAQVNKLAAEGLDVEFDARNEKTFEYDFECDYELKKSDDANKQHIRTKLLTEWFVRLSAGERRKIYNTSPTVWMTLERIYKCEELTKHDFTVDDIYSDLTSGHTRGIFLVDTFLENCTNRIRQANNLIDVRKIPAEPVINDEFDSDAPTTIIVDGVEKTESDTLNYNPYNPDVPDDMSHVVDGDYLIESECADKRTMIDPYYSLGVDATKDSDIRDFKSEYDTNFNDIVNKPTPSMSDNYEKIAYPKFSEFVLRDFDVVVDSRLVDKAIRRLDAVRRMLAPIKSIIREEEALLDQLNKIMSKIGFREEFVNPAIDPTAIAKIKRVPNNQDELILVTTTGMTVSELQNRITGLTGKLHGLKIKRERIEFEIIKLEAFLELDENVAYSELFVDENVIIAVKKIEGIVVGIVTNHSGEKLLESVDFISPQDTYDESIAMRRLIRKYYDSFDSDITDTDSDCIGNGNCETCGGCGYGVDHPEDN